MSVGPSASKSTQEEECVLGGGGYAGNACLVAAALSLQLCVDCGEVCKGKHVNTDRQSGNSLPRGIIFFEIIHQLLACGDLVRGRSGVSRAAAVAVSTPGITVPKPASSCIMERKRGCQRWTCAVFPSNGEISSLGLFQTARTYPRWRWLVARCTVVYCTCHAGLKT